MYIYESHMGGFYITDEVIDDEYLYCDSCGDSDVYQCEANNKRDVRDFIYSLPEWYDRNYLNGLQEEWEARFDELES